MGHILDIPTDVLSIVMIILAMSQDGARDLARASATCKEIKSVARESEVLKVVNFQSLISAADDYGAHIHPNGLLCQCARAGNVVAQSMIGKALLLKNPSFWNMVLENNESQLLRHQKLVRSFICVGSFEEIYMMRTPLLNYMISFLGYDVAHLSGILYVIRNMCGFFGLRKIIGYPSDVPENVENVDSLVSIKQVLDRKLASPPPLMYRQLVLVRFNHLFRSSLM